MSCLLKCKLRFNDKTKQVSIFDILIPTAGEEMSAQKEEANKAFSKLWMTYCPALENDTVELKALAEFRQWRCKWRLTPKEHHPVDLVQPLRMCDQHVLPTIHRLLTIVVVIPVSTAASKRSYSVLRLLKTYLRSQTGENRLNGLAQKYIHSMERDGIHSIERELTYTVWRGMTYTAWRELTYTAWI